ncbi:MULTISPECIES: hypothetical protein [Vibrio]|uniref:hypothetical protein n=1 Tax=Vibrio TaxID=662 RepID=UPI0010FD7109|nr:MULTISPECIES: hypothetical protein [Vibrio]MDF4534036.1 hypothetical protein [Vibrio parahaemolyticus]EGQ7791240.1 hypothetical protein [Vibrio cholerae]EGQ9395974.1 hypothetical protein [Vibrio cholerae]EGR0264889.1 hypothetical protein [Vibrio cholerae]EHS1094402.1 hypothetical protein [Vibrio cholerae]
MENRMASFIEIQEFLKKHGQDHILENIVKNESDDSYVLCSRNNLEKHPSRKYQIACVLTLLGEYELASKLYPLDWKNLSRFGDSLGNALLKEFIKDI